MKLIKKSIIFAIIMIIAVSFSYNYDAYAESYNSISDSSDDDWVYNEYYYIVLSAKEIYSGTLSWKNNSTGWWVEDSTGWYPQNQWQKIDGIWYFLSLTDIWRKMNITMAIGSMETVHGMSSII